MFLVPILRSKILNPTTFSSLHLSGVRDSCTFQNCEWRRACSCWKFRLGANPPFAFVRVQLSRNSSELGVVGHYCPSPTENMNKRPLVYKFISLKRQSVCTIFNHIGPRRHSTAESYWSNFFTLHLSSVLKIKTLRNESVTKRNYCENVPTTSTLDNRQHLNLEWISFLYREWFHSILRGDTRKRHRTRVSCELPNFRGIKRLKNDVIAKQNKKTHHFSTWNARDSKDLSKCSWKEVTSCCHSFSRFGWF